MSLETLQIYWWCIVSLLGGILVFMMFVQGAQSMIFSLGKEQIHRSLIINSVGRKWELTFTTLVVFGGACFAAFPLFYATSFGGAYWVWLSILFCFIIQAVSYEYRKKPNNLFGERGYEIFLFINGTFGVVLIGIAVATFFSGSDFKLNDHNFVEWLTPYRGLEALTQPMLYSLGFTLFFLARVGGCLYMINNINDNEFRKLLRQKLKVNAVLFLLFLVVFLVWVLTKDGYAVAPDGTISLVSYKYALNFIKLPIVLIVFLLGALLAVFGIFKGIFTQSIYGIVPFGFGVVMVGMSLFLIAGLNSTAFYPSSAHLQSSLTIQNASSTLYTLKVMSYVSLMVPFVLGYIAYVWKAIDRDKLTVDEIKNSHHTY